MGQMAEGEEGEEDEDEYHAQRRSSAGSETAGPAPPHPERQTREPRRASTGSSLTVTPTSVEVVVDGAAMSEATPPARQAPAAKPEEMPALELEGAKAGTPASGPVNPYPSPRATLQRVRWRYRYM